MAMKGPLGLSDMIQNFPNFDFEVGKFFPVDFEARTPSNSSFDLAQYRPHRPLRLF
jgi:hypothetical protein